MNIPVTIMEGFVKVFFTQDGFLKHVCLFALTGIVSFIPAHLQKIGEELQKGSGNFDISSNLGFIVFAIIAFIVISIYLAGYYLKFQHNAFDNKSNEIMPDFDGNPIGVFCKALPLYLVWGIYYILITAVMGFLFIKPLLIIIGIFALLFLMVYFAFVQFVFVAFAKDYDSKGLFNIALPLSYIKPAIGPVCICGLIFIIICILAFIIPFTAGLIMGIFSVDSTITTTVGGMLGGYIGAILQLIWIYCIVQIYRETIEPENYTEQQNL